MDKWENQMKKMNNESLPGIVEQRITQTLASLPRKRRFTKIKYASLAAIITFSILIGASMISPAFAETLKSLPFINTITNLIDDLGMKSGYEKGIAIPVQDKYIIKGKEVTFTEVMYDGTAVYLGYLVSSSPFQEQSELLYDMELLIDDQRIGYGIDHYGELTDDQLYAGRLKINPAGIELPDQFKMQIQIDGIKANFYVEKKGTIDVYETTESRRLGDLLINYNSVAFTPTATVISYDEIARAFNELIGFVVIDDKGRVLKQIDSTGIGDKDLYVDTDGKKKAIGHHTVSLEPLDEKPAYLTIKPYFHIFNQEGSIGPFLTKWEGKPLTLSQGEPGNVLISDIQRENDDVSVYITTYGIDEYQQASRIDIQDEDGNFFDSSFSQVDIHKYKVTFKKFPEESDIFLRTWQVKDNKYIPELEVTIPIEDKK